MIKSRQAIFSVLMLLSVFWPLSSAQAEQPFQRFLPFLVDLDGWQGKKPDGMAMQMANMNMITATREYQRGPAQLHASVVIGQTAEGALAPLQSGMNIQTSDGHVITATMHGMQVLKTFNTPQKSGALIVGLAKDAMFNLGYQGITEDEALALAEKFDWKAIQTAAQAK
jgi:hypothetical protein